jgi:hypothetical protein
MGVAMALAVLTGCTSPPPPPIDRIDLRDAPRATRDALLRVKILPLGLSAPPNVGLVGPILSYGCGSTAIAATTDAIQQLRAKAVRVQATAVVDVLLGPGESGPCNEGYSATASGIAVAERGIAPAS